MTTNAVYEEVVTTGIDEGHADARRIEHVIENGLLSVEEVDQTVLFERLRKNDRLSIADASVLALADQHDGTAIVDERYGRAVASAETVPTRGTAYIVLRLHRDDILTADEAQETIDEMVDAGWYCAPDLYAKISRKIDELSE
ncbi:DUF3368 domain-containing protein [Halosolutus amylolyticus]|uniref:DUF3368 domain-containing protein n=1 Tax=Halosolutus amylolyticus TaxID=2932267 RepID=A0ABD5PML2_9EURY|nr:DUF3368 domain-containing protein [Halosolutus amylolyticus]